MNCRKLHNDGNGSYSYNVFTMTKKSWFARPEEAYSEAFEEMKKIMADKPGNDYEVTSFSRI